MKALRMTLIMMIAAVLCVMPAAVLIGPSQYAYAEDDEDDYDYKFGPVPADVQAIEPGDVKDVIPKSDDEVVTYSFTPEESGDYSFGSLGDEDTEGIVFTDSELVGEDYDSGMGDNFLIYFHADAGVTYYLQACYGYTENIGPYQIKLEKGSKPVGFANLPEDPEDIIQISSVVEPDDEDYEDKKVSVQTDTAGKVVTFKFVPPADGLYGFNCDNLIDQDLDLCVFTEDELIGTVDAEDFGSEVRFYGYKDKTYYCQARAHGANYEVIAFVRNEDDEISSSEMGEVTFCGKEIVTYNVDSETYEVVQDLPEGVEVDLPNKTVTLTDCKYDVSGIEKCNSYIDAGGDINIVVNGNNEFTGLDAVDYVIGTGIRTTGRLTITGSGSLSMSMVHSTGIEAGHSIEIDGPSVTIAGEPTLDPAMFYGMTLQAWSNYYEYPYLKDEFFIRIQNAELNISNTAAGAAMNMGIDSQDADLIISNSKVSIDLEGGRTWGMGSGLYRSGDHYGGRLSVDDKSMVKIKLTETHESLIKDDIENDLLYALYFYEDDIDSNYIYAAEHGGSAKQIQKTDFYKYEDMDNRIEAHYSFIDLSPVEQSYGNSGHVMEYHGRVTPTCTEGGNKEYWYCTDCRKYFGDADGKTEIQKDSWVLDATGHGLSHQEPVAPTDGAWGTREYWYCARCDKVFSDAECSKPYYGESYGIPPTKHVHEMVKIESVPATTDYEGNIEYYRCYGCRKAFADVEGKNEYLFGEWIIPKLDDDEPHVHDMSKTNAVAATCTTAGNSAYYYCSGCESYFSDEAGEHEIEKNSWVIAELGHNMTKTDAVAATCTTAGNSAYHYCSRCKKYFSDKDGKNEIVKDSWIIAKLGHSMKKTDAVAATCTAAGNSAYYYCSRCKKYFSDETGEHEIEKDSWIIAKLGHSMKKTDAVAATCTAAGNSAYYYCSRCKKYFSDEAGEHEIEKNSWIIAKLGHSMTKTDAKDPTTTEAGNTAYYYCSRCKKYFSDEAGEKEIEKDSWIIPPTGDEPHVHDMTHYPASDPSCTEDGNTEYWYCDGCKKYFGDEAGENETNKNSWIIAKLGHSMTKTEAKDPTATEAGNSAYYYCSRCKKYFSDEAGKYEIEKDSWIIPPTGEPEHVHNMTKTDAVEATCTEAGNSAYWYCDGCKKYFGDENGEEEIEKDSWIIPPTGEPEHVHNMTYYPAAKPTCTVDGNTEYWYCDGCKKYFSDENGENKIAKNSWIIPAPGHTEVIDEAKPATCTEDGCTEGKHCSVCSEVLIEQTVLPAFGHKWSAWTVTKKPTDTEDGLKERICLNDPTHTEEQKIPAGTHVHELTHEKEIPATCTENGRKEYWYCEGCGTYFSDENGENELAGGDDLTIKAKGHKEMILPGYEAKCMTSGYTDGVICSVCKTVLVPREVIPAIGRHSWEEDYYFKATIWSRGERAYHCVECYEDKYKYYAKLKPKIKLSAKKKKIRRRKSFTLTVSRIQRGDEISSVKPSRKGIVKIKKTKKNKYKITGSKKGKTVITVRLLSGKKARCSVTVN